MTCKLVHSPQKNVGNYTSILGITSDHMFPAMIDGGVVINDNEAKAELFNKLFLEQSHIDDIGPPVTYQTILTCQEL